MLALIIISGSLYVIIQLLLAIACYLPLAYDPKSDEPLPSISVVIAARNEAKNLHIYLPQILAQPYPKFEVWVLLDRCTDSSKEVVLALQKDHKNLFFLEIHELPEGWAGKKWAIHQGITHANYECLAFIDADCSPGKEWISSVGYHFQHQKELVLGIGHYYQKPGLLNACIQFETFYTAFQYIGFAKLGYPYMGVGRNLAYRKSFYIKYGGFSSIKGRISGDDDLLVNQYARASHTACLQEKESASYSSPKTKVKEWINQKLRHLSASPAYSLKSKVLLSIFHGSHLLFYLGILLFLVFQQTFWLFWASYIGRIMISWILFLGIRKKLQFKSSLYLFPVLDLLYFIYNLSLVPIGYILKRKAWS